MLKSVFPSDEVSIHFVHLANTYCGSIETKGDEPGVVEHAGVCAACTRVLSSS
jgi:hypothetical protein